MVLDQGEVTLFSFLANLNPMLIRLQRISAFEKKHSLVMNN